MHLQYYRVEVLSFYRRWWRGISYASQVLIRTTLPNQLQGVFQQRFMRVENRSALIAITDFQLALNEYDALYHSLPAQYSTCLTLPLPGTKKSNERGRVLESKLESYPAWLTLGSNDQPNGPLLAYYAALYGERTLLEKEGQEYLEHDFYMDSPEFLKKVQPLLDTLGSLEKSKLAVPGFRAGPGQQQMEVDRAMGEGSVGTVHPSKSVVHLKKSY